MKNKSLLINYIIVILEIIGLFLSYIVNRRIGIEFYTEESNILLLISSLLFVFYILLNKKIPRWLQLFKYMSTICVSITFIIVIFVLSPMFNFNYLYMLFHNELLYHHFLCPVLSVITFLYFDEIGNITKKDSFIGSYITLFYAFILIILNIFRIVDGPYPFLRVYNQSIFESIIWFVLIIGTSFGIGISLQKMYNKIRKKA